MVTIILVALVIGFVFCCILVASAIGIAIGQRHPIKQNAPKAPAPKPQPQASVPPQTPAKVACKHCGRLNKFNVKHCVGCGKPIGNCGKLPPTCPSCKQPQRPGSKFCQKCGQPTS